MQSSLKDLIKIGEESPFYQLLNIKIEEVRKNHARLSIKVGERHIQMLNTVHGGVIASLADSAAAWAILGNRKLRSIPVTVEMKINFLGPVKSGRLVAEAETIHEGSKIIVSDEVKSSRGVLVAKSLVTYYLVDDK
jgi:uncharacterized protein (TIGR00369 family)